MGLVSHVTEESTADIPLIAHCYFVGRKKFVHSNEHDAFYFSMYQIAQHGKI